MDAADDDAPDAKKQRVGESFHRVRKDTFVEAMLTGVSTTLASDAEYGYNSANRIRQRVEDITSAIDDFNRTEKSISSSRAVLESRFALGADDSQYLSQCISLLWAGDGGEKLRVAPLASMPEIMRVASARGIVRAMGGIVKRQRRDEQEKIKRALRIAGWLMQVQVVRDAILSILNDDCAGDTYSKIAYTAIKVAFETQGVQAGTAAVISIGEDHGMECARSVIFAFLMLTNPESRASDVVNQLVDAMNGVVERAESNLAQLFNTASAMDGAFGRVYVKGVAEADQYTQMEGNPGLELGVCQSFAEYDPLLPLGNDVYPSFKQFATSVSEAVGRISGRFTNVSNEGENVSSVVNPPDAENVIRQGDMPQNGKAWYLDHVLSPMWKHKNAADWTEALGAGYQKRSSAQAFPQATTSGESTSQAERTGEVAATLPKRKTDIEASRDMRSVVSAHNRRRETYSSGKIGQFASSLLDGRVVSDEGFVQFCIIRGLCGFRGIHQVASGAADEVVRYDYPETDLPQYSRGEFASLLELQLPPDIAQQVRECEREMYPTGNIDLDTDFFANATKDVRPNMPLFAQDDQTSSSTDKARRAAWLPLDRDRNDVKQLNTESFSKSVCKASVYEFMVLSLMKPSMQGDQSVTNLTLAAAAVAKVRQVHLNAVAKSTSPGSVMHSTSEMGEDVYVTRPCSQCSGEGSVFDSDKLLLPVDAGVACFKQFERAAQPLVIPPPSADTPKNEHPYFMAMSIDTPIPNVSLSAFLSSGMQTGWRDPPDGQPTAQSAERQARPSEPYGLYIGASACAEPFDNRESQLYDMGRQNSKIDPDDLSPDTLFKTFLHATLAFDQIEQMDCEEEYVKRFQSEGSKESQEVFGIHRSLEDASRDRRADIWTDALREVAISGDRLYRFVTELTGAIGEAADSAIAWEDEDLKAMSKEASNRQKAMAERVSRFQTKLVESVVTSTLKASKLQLDVRNNPGNELVVINTDVKDGIRQITSGEAGHGFFEASVELNNLLGSASQPITIKQLVTKLRNVSMEFQEQLKDSLAASTPASFSRISEPRNSFMLHLKPDTIAAVHKAFDLITSEMNMCPGYHRHVYLWEYVEGKDWVLSSRFAELVGLVLQNTRMRSGSFAAYVGTSQIITNTHNVRMQLQRLKTQACSYIMQTDTPQFLSPTGRTLYFGGAVSETTVDMKRRDARNARAQGAASFGGDSGDTWWIWSSVANLSPGEFDARDTIVRRINDIYERIKAGKLSADAVLMSKGDQLRFQANPRRKRVHINGATQGQINSSLVKLMIEQIKNFGTTPEDLLRLASADVELAYHNAVLDPTSGAPVSEDADTCSQLAPNPMNTWVAAACKQYSTQTGQRVNQETKKFELPIPQMVQFNNNPQRQSCYVVKFEPPPSTRTDEVQKRVNSTLNFLFVFEAAAKEEWIPHPEWNSNDDFKNMWVKKVQDSDAKHQKAYGLSASLSNIARVALGGKRRLVVMGLVAYVFNSLCPDATGRQLLFEKVGNTTAALALKLPSVDMSYMNMGPVEFSKVYTSVLPGPFAIQCKAAWEYRMVDAKEGLERYKNRSTESEKEMHMAYSQELSILNAVEPLIEQLNKAAEQNDKKRIGQILETDKFKDFSQNDLSMEVLRQPLSDDQWAGEVLSECQQLMNDSALTLESIRQCFEKRLDDTQIAKLMRMQVQRLDNLRGAFRAQLESRYKRVSDTVERVQEATTNDQYKKADPYGTLSFSPFTVELQGNGFKTMEGTIQSMIQDLEKQHREEDEQQLNDRSKVNNNPVASRRIMVLRSLIGSLKEAQKASRGTTSQDRANGESLASQEAMYPVWAFLTWPVADQESFQKPIVLAYSLILNEAVEKGMDFESFVHRDEYKEVIFGHLNSIPYLNEEDRQKVLNILREPRESGGHVQYVRIVELTLKLAFEKMIKQRDETSKRLQEYLEGKLKGEPPPLDSTGADS